MPHPDLKAVSPDIVVIGYLDPSSDYCLRNAVAVTDEFCGKAEPVVEYRIAYSLESYEKAFNLAQWLLKHLQRQADASLVAEIFFAVGPNVSTEELIDSENFSE
jgi:hypothetical protein